MWSSLKHINSNGGYLITAIAAIALAGIPVYGQSSSGRTFVPLRLDFASPGVAIGLYGNAELETATLGMHMSVKRSNVVYMLHSMDEFRGYVRISSGTQALTFVRLRTCPLTALTIPGGAMEVVDQSQARALPTFGLKFAFGVPFPGLWYLNAPSGTCGVLSDRAYREGHFSPPSVTTVDGRYHIVRWVYQIGANFQESVCEVEEDVAPDGHYSEAIIKRTDPPTLTGTKWQMPYESFE